jgi:uncharacterized surface protein with fasciclin (FAS1) repeats
MKTPTIFKFLNGYRPLVLGSLLIGLLFSFCSEDKDIGTRLNEDDPSVYDYLKTNSDQYSEFAKLIELTKTVDLLRGLKDLTILLPTNTAMLEYYKEKKITSLEDFPDAVRQSLLRNHILPTMQKTTDIYLGALQDTNALGDYLESGFIDGEIVLNGTAKITTRNLLVAGNLIQVIDKILEPVTKDIYTVISEDPSYSIFSEALQLTGLNDTLQKITVPYFAKNVRTRFTLLAVADTTYNRFGIQDVNDLIDWCGESTTGDYDSKMHPFYRYIEYHCLAGTYYLNYFNNESKYSAISQVNSISMAVTDDYKINLDPTTNKYTGFFIPFSNITAKNGVIHSVNNLLPLPKLQEFIFETTDYFEIKQGQFYRNGQKDWYDGVNSLSKIKFLSPKLQYNGTSSPSENYLNSDYLLLPNFKWIEIETPEIPAGSYKISSKMRFTYLETFPKVNVFIDDVFRVELTDNLQVMDFGSVKWTTSDTHRIKIECPDLGNMTWDYIVFTPIQD